MGSLFRVVVTAAITLAPLAPAFAGPPAPRATYVEIDPARASVAAGPLDSAILYLNRCAGGCTVTPGYEDSRENRSSIIDSPYFIPEFDSGDEAWGAVVGCVRGMYADFDITVTDQDPGNVPHFEAIIAGRPGDIGFPYNVGGVSPFTCGVIENAITYTFAAVYGDKPQQICQVVAQESAHAFGLDHEMLCEDPMTYLNGCGIKCFRDFDASCGESAARPCQCGGQRQNSWQTIRDLFGDAPERQQSVNVLAPLDGATVPAGFHVEIEVAVTCFAQVEGWIGDLYLGVVDTWPYILDTPLDLPEGPATIRVMATDQSGATTETTIDVVVGTPIDPPPPPPPPSVDAAPPAVDEPEPQADCGCATVGDDGRRLGWSFLLAAVALGLRRRRAN